MREKTVSKKENLFAASRFVLPEHRDMYVRIKAEERRYVPPQLDEEQQAELSEEIWRAVRTGYGVYLTYYDGEAARQRFGHVAHVDPASGRLKLKTAEETLWIPFARLLQVRLAATP
jgi:hypothetical protein